MNLLLLLTALFASLTGAGWGDRAVRQVHDVTVVRAAEAVQVAVDPAQRAIPAPPVAQAQASAPHGWIVSESPALPSAEQRFERRLE